MEAPKFNMFQMPYKIWLILIGTFLTSATYWMTWPFLTIILNQQYQLSPSLIGAVLSISVIFSTLAGIYLGNLSDRIGRSKMMVIGIGVSATSYLLLAFASNLMVYYLAIGLVSLARALVDPLSKAIFGDMTENSEDRAAALHVRYFVVNLGAACGPLIGVYLGLAAQQSTFSITAISFLVYLFLLYPLLEKSPQTIADSSNHKKTTFFNSLKILINDRAFVILMVMNIFLWIVFVQFESTIALYFSILNVPDLAEIVSLMIFTNTATVILLQFPLLKLMKKLNVSYRIYLSIMILGLSQLIFAFAPAQSYLWFIIGTIIFSIAEVILIPNLNIIIDQMARNDLRGSYFAASFLYRIGCGAYIGGLLLQETGGTGLFLGMFFICLIAAGLYFYSSKVSQTELAIC